MIVLFSIQQRRGRRLAGRASFQSNPHTAMLMPSMLFNMDMDDFTDDIWVEICIRLPCKNAVRCKSISKRLLNLISGYTFIERFIYRLHSLFQQMKDEDREKEWSLVFLSRHKLLILFLPNIHMLAFDLSNPVKQLSLSFLGPDFNLQHEDKIEATFLTSNIIGCSNGLLLCRKSPYEKVYYVCNPVTRDSVQLPPCSSSSSGFASVFEGFICEPYYHVESEGVTVRPRHRFRVVLIPYFNGTKSEFEVLIFSSETGRWSTSLVSCPKGFTQAVILLPAVAYRGRLYFLGKKSVLVYDPFNNDRQCHVLDYPTDSNPRNIISRGHLGLSCGNIRISDISPRSSPHRAVSVWELKGDSSWRLLHRTCLPPLERGNSVRPELGSANCDDVRVRAFHPYHGDIVFFQYAHRIFFGNLKTNKFETAGYGTQSLQIVPLELPWWPTPVPSIE